MYHCTDTTPRTTNMAADDDSLPRRQRSSSSSVPTNSDLSYGRRNRRRGVVGEESACRRHDIVVVDNCSSNDGCGDGCFHEDNDDTLENSSSGCGSERNKLRMRRCVGKLTVGSCKGRRATTTTNHGMTILFVLSTLAFTKHVSGSGSRIAIINMLSSTTMAKGGILPIADAFVIPSSPLSFSSVGGSKLRRRYISKLLPSHLTTHRSMQNDCNSLDASLPSTETSYVISTTNLHDGKNKVIATPVGNVSSTTPSQTSSTNEYSFFDEATIYVRAGSGGQGSSTYKKVGKNQDGPADGGDGGTGGDVVLRVDESMNTLAGLSRYAYRPNAFGGGGAAATANKRRGAAGWVLSFRAENGNDGERQNRRGRNGKDVVVRVPPGTIVQEEVTEEPPPDDADPDRPAIRYVDRGTITRDDPTLVIATGGTGGDGSGGPADKSQPRGIRTPRMPPRPGERLRLKLTLKVVADVALVAVPNAGKSTLLAKVTRAKPKIADYPFTTVVPNLGVWVPPYYSRDNGDDDGDDETTDSNNGKSLVICDVPGLIAGASEGVGLGHAFLRHVERCHVILHLLDATSASVLDEYAMINRELLNYGTGKLATMPQVVVVNKLDSAFGNDNASENDGRFRSREELEGELLKIMPHSRLMWISAKEGDGVDELMGRVAMFVNKVKSTIAAEEGKRKMGDGDGDA